MPSPILRFFETGHLPRRLAKVSEPLKVVAIMMENELLDGPEKDAGLRKLLEAKDCFVRAAIP